jgi:hypothetical protein
MKKLLGIAVLALYVVALAPIQFASAQTVAPTGALVSFSPAGGNIPKDTNFDVNIIVNTGGQPSAAADVTVKFDSTKLDFVSGTYPDSNTFYPSNRVIYPIAANSGKISMARTVSTPASGEVVYTNGSGTFATLTFKTKASAQIGDTTTLSFEYTPGATNDFTNVANSSTPAQDLLGNSTLPTATYTIGAVVPPVGTDPVITSIAPTSGPSNEIVGVTITGTNFGAYVDGQSKVYVGTKLVTIHNWTDTSIFIDVDAEPNLKADSLRQVKVHRADGKEATFLGYKLIASGPEVFIWGGIVLASMLMAWFVYRRMNVLVPATANYAAAAMPMPIMNYQPEAPVSQITYRDWQ